MYTRTMTPKSHFRVVLRQAVKLQADPKSMNKTPALIINAFANNHAVGAASKQIRHRAYSTSYILQSPLWSTSSFLRPFISDTTSMQHARHFGRHFSTQSNSPDAPKLSTKATSDPFTEASSDKSIFAKLWDRYSFEGQTKRIILGERLFRAAQVRANDV
jgi:hypothetical protein